MKTLHALLLFLLVLPALSPKAHAGPASLAIMSDVDDTIRPTGVKHAARGFVIARGFKKVKPFSGMKMLYDRLLNNAKSDPAKDEYFISGSPFILSVGSLKPWLKEGGLSTEHVKIRFLGPLRDIGTYKEDQFKKFLTDNPKTSFLFLGDDTEKDPISLDWAMKNFPRQVAGRYIHVIEGLTKVEDIQALGEIPYFTAVEVALREVKNNRLKAEDVGIVAQAMLDDSDFQWDVIPVYAKVCPDAGWISKLVDDLQFSPPVTPATMQKIHDIESKVAAICTPDRKPRSFEKEDEEKDAERAMAKEAGK